MMPPKTRHGEGAERQAARLRTAIIGRDLLVTGDVEGDIELIVEGRIQGSVSATHVIIGEGAHVDATLFADKLVIRGRYFGRAIAPVVEVGSTAQVSGSIVHNEMTAEKGSMVDGLMPWRPVSFFEQGAHEYELTKNTKSDGRQR